MQTFAASTTLSDTLPAASGGSLAPQAGAPTSTAYQAYQIIRRNGAVVSFEPSKIAVALMKAFLAVHGTSGAASASVRETVEGLTENVVRALLRSRPAGGSFHIEDIQDAVELGLMRGGHHEVARAYVLYRERRHQERVAKGEAAQAAVIESGLTVIDNGQRIPLDLAHLQSLIVSACEGLGADVKPEPILAETKRNLYDGVPIDEVYKASILAARTLIEKDPGYSRATARLLLHTIRREVVGGEITQEQMVGRYAEYFPAYIKKGVKAELLDEKLAQYDLVKLGAALKAERDLQFDYLVCRPCMTATSSISTMSVSRCRRPSSCASRWVLPSMRSTAKPAPSSSTKCCRALTSCPARRPCSTRAPAVRSFPAAT
jgi:ribonucleoside-diphosphate reductase alpha chain